MKKTEYDPIFCDSCGYEPLNEHCSDWDFLGEDEHGAEILDICPKCKALNGKRVKDMVWFMCQKNPNAC